MSPVLLNPHRFAVDPASTYAGLLATHTPAGVWWCEETSGTTLVDSSGNARNGTIDAGVTLNSTAILPNRSGGSHDIDATEGSIIPTDTWINSATGITAIIWAVFDTLVGEDVVMARANVNGTNSAGQKPWAMLVNNTGQIYGRAYSATAATAVPTSATGVITTGTLYMLAFVQTTSTVRYVVNGVTAATASLAGGPVPYVTSARSITLGKSSDGTYAMDGRIKAAAYITTPLTDSDLLALNSAGRAV